MRACFVIAVALVCTIISVSADNTLPPVIIGSPSRIELSCTDLLKSMAWWSRFGFAPQSRQGDKIDSAITLTDGQLIITLVKTSQPSPVLIFRCANTNRLKEQLDSLTVRTNMELEGPAYCELRFRSPNSVFLAVRVSTIETHMQITGDLNPICGKLTELSTAADHIAVEQQWWADLGFVASRRDSVPYKFVNMTDGHIEIGIHEDRDITGLAFTYFMPDMEQRIDRLKKSGLVPVDEFPTNDGRIGNAIFSSPDGQQVYLFEGTK